MAVRVVQVDESQKDEPGVEKAVTTIAGQRIETYARLVRVDDMDGETTDDVVEIQMLIPVEDEDAGEGDPPFVYNRAVMDMGPKTREEYMKAIEPFADKARLVSEVKPKPATTTTRAYTGASPALKEWNRRAKAWARKAGHEVKERGKVPKHLEELYVKNNPDDPKPE